MAQVGLVKGQKNLGFMYANGEGVPEDDAEAVKWYRLAAEKGHADAQTNLGAIWSEGQAGNAKLTPELPRSMATVRQIAVGGVKREGN
jgi:TPR repeat protein